MGIINRNVKSKANIVCTIALSGKQLFVLRHLAKSVVFLDFADTHSVRIQLPSFWSMFRNMWYL